jgi:putative acetyltransferase
MIEITPYRTGVCADLHRIFFDTVRTINIRDYNQAQVEAWAPSDSDLLSWEARIESIKPYLATLNGEIAGFADLQEDGYIDMFFCRADMQGMGVGGALMSRLIEEAQSRSIAILYSNVSITARPLFERFGFTILNSQEVHVGGQILLNYKMEMAL